ncbi:MAG TPA: hypothetical protein VLT32_09505 [Candidatus Sulfomarinibacteraceae bacterium]|nr:hypothetical protein [Candidatus Sulfomarinibacteraceae bacterium]
MTLGRLRLLVRRAGRRLGPMLVTVVAVAAAGLGLHGALDWHRHGEPGVGFFHLHVHFGDHEHPDHHHGGLEPPSGPDTPCRDRAVGDPAEPAPPEPEPANERRHAGVLTLALGVAPAPTTATVAGPALEPSERAPVAARRLADRPSERRAWSPRGPPA